MYYKPGHQKGWRIPVPIALLLIGISMYGLNMLLNKTPLQVAQKTDVTIIDSEIGNVRDNAVTIYWKTSKPAVSYVLYGEGADSISSTNYDDRESAGFQKPRQNHVTTLKNLSSEKTYYFRIVVDKAALGQTAQSPFLFKTTRKLVSPNDSHPIYGRVVDVQGKPVEDAIVVASFSQSFSLIGTTKNDGTFLISTCCVYSTNSFEPYLPAVDARVDIKIIGDNGLMTTQTSTLAQASPLTKNLVMTNQALADARDTSPPKTGVLSPGTAKDAKSILGATDEKRPYILGGSSIGAYNQVDIIYPKQGTAIPGTRPLIKGVGTPGEYVNGLFSPSGSQFRARVADDTTWTYSPKVAFSPGEHVLTVSSPDKSGTNVSVIRNFVIGKSGESVLGEATGSATLAPTQPAEMTSFPTEPITPLPTEMLTVTPPPPISGINDAIPIVIAGIALIFIGVGVILIY